MTTDPALTEHLDAGPQSHRALPRVNSGVSLRSDQSKDLPPHLSMETTSSAQKPQTHRAPSPIPSCVSVRSDWSKATPPDLSRETTSSAQKPQTHRAPSPDPSCVSVRSNWSKATPPDLSRETTSSAQKPQTHRAPSPIPSCVSVRSDWSKDKPLNFSRETTSSAQKLGHQTNAQHENSYRTQPAVLGELADKSESSIHQHPDHTSVRASSRVDDVMQNVKENHKMHLRKTFGNISEGINNMGTETPLTEVYTELYMTEGGFKWVNQEHEVCQAEIAQTTEDKPIDYNDIFKPHTSEKHIKTVMTEGVAGIGKTVTVQKFILDWTDGIANKDVDFIFSFSFRELNLVKNDQYSLHSLLLDFYPESSELKKEEYKQVLFIFDGLDESRISLNFQSKMLVSDIEEVSSVDVLITRLIEGSLLSNALIWITSRPAAASQIPLQYTSRMTVVRGFNDLQKEEYFKKHISDECQAKRIISHIRECRSLHIMCHIPVFCWIAATVLQQMLQNDTIQEIPKTLTEMFIGFLLNQTTREHQRHQHGTQANREHPLESNKKAILKLAELAFKNLQRRNVLFCEDDLRECDIDVDEASVYYGLCTKILKEDSVFKQRKVFCFIHLTIQEFLAALHVFVSYTGQQATMGSFFSWEKSLKLAITNVLESRDGHLDLFLRFLMGISLERNRMLLKGLLSYTPTSQENIKVLDLIAYILKQDDLSPERCFTLLQCLSEVNDETIYQEIDPYLKSPESFKNELSAAHCSALAHMLLMSGEVLEDLDLKKYNTSDEGRRRMIPAVRCFKRAQLVGCKLTQKTCESVMRCLQSANDLIQLDLSCNAIGDPGMQRLSTGLTSPYCKLQILRLSDCGLSQESCKVAAHVLKSQNSLTELDLSHNDLGDSGVQFLCEGLVSTCCKLQVLRLSGCLISVEGCRYLASALTQKTSHLLKELDLSYNHPEESGLALLKDPHCSLETLNTDHCAEIRFRRGLQKYAFELTLDSNTAHRYLHLSEDKRKVTRKKEEMCYPYHEDRFDELRQVFCRESQSGRCYWEAEWDGAKAGFAVAYGSMPRKKSNDDSWLGRHEKSWNVLCLSHMYLAWHNNEYTVIRSSSSRRIGVYLNWLAGTVSFYSVTDKLNHLHTFHSTFTEPLYPAFRLYADSSVSLCKVI